MSTTTRLELEALAKLGMGFHVYLGRGASGDRIARLSVEEAIAFAENPTATMAEHYGVSEETFLGWKESAFTATCCAQKADGSPCRVAIKGGLDLASPAKWLALQGRLCAKHLGMTTG